MDGRDVGVSDGCNDPSGEILGNDHGSALDDGAPVGTSDPTEGPWETLGEPDRVELMMTLAFVVPVNCHPSTISRYGWLSAPKWEHSFE
jgi:hypothetical protein